MSVELPLESVWKLRNIWMFHEMPRKQMIVPFLHVFGNMRDGFKKHNAEKRNANTFRLKHDLHSSGITGYGMKNIELRFLSVRSKR